MNLQSFHYFYEVAKDLNITRTAERLYTSQQNLSYHIKQMEEFFGTPLFYRKPSLKLTYAGECVLSFAHDIESKQKNLRDIIRDIKSEESGEINFGISSLRANAILPYILLPFSDMYPNVEMHFTNRRSQELIQLTLDGDLDAAIVLEPEEKTSAASKELNYIKLPTETIYLCVSDRLLNKYYGSDAVLLKEKARSGADITDFIRLPFALLSNQIGKAIDECFLQSGSTPNIYTRSDSMQFTTTLSVEGVAASFVMNTSVFSYRSFLVPDLNFFPVMTDGKILRQEWFLIHRKDRYLTQHIKYFFDEILRIAAYIDLIPISEILKPETYAQIIKDLRDPYFLQENSSPEELL